MVIQPSQTTNNLKIEHVCKWWGASRLVTQATNPQQRRLRKQNSKHNCFAYLLIFFCGLPEWASKFTYAVSPPDCKDL